MLLTASLGQHQEKGMDWTRTPPIGWKGLLSSRAEIVLIMGTTVPIALSENSPDFHSCLLQI